MIKQANLTIRDILSKFITVEKEKVGVLKGLPIKCIDLSYDVLGDDDYGYLLKGSDHRASILIENGEILELAKQLIN